MAIGRGNLEIITTENERIYTPLYHVPDSSGTLLSPDFMCAESNGQYVQFHIGGDITTGKGSIDLCDKKTLANGSSSRDQMVYGIFSARLKCTKLAHQQ